LRTRDPQRRSLRFRLTAAAACGLAVLALVQLLVARFVSPRFPVATWLIPPLVVLGGAYVQWALVGRWVSDRLRRITTSDETPDEGPGAGPADDETGDEISEVARGVAALRRRVGEQVQSYGLQDIRRREWIAQVSHDLRTPLTAQAACLDRAVSILAESGTELPRAELAEVLAVAKMDGERVHTLADDLLEIARLDAGDRLQLEPVPPGELVRQAVRGLDPLASKRGLAVSVQVTPQLPMLNADGRRLMRAIENLMRNAIQHASSKVDVLALLAGTDVRFEVRDDGSGLPKDPEFLDSLRRRSSSARLAELAKRGSRADSAGLGLIVAQRVAEAHGGNVDAYNLSSGGAAFHVDIPVRP
jgi:signal transduction histidine kinase